MPGMDGYEVLEKLKENELFNSIPVIIITGMSRAEDEVKGLLLGAVDYITKPFHEIIVKARVDTHVKIASQMRMIEQLGSVDLITNLYNRRQFVDLLIHEWNQAVTNEQPISVLMIDVDNFAEFNNEFGEKKGDNALKVIAGSIKSSLYDPGYIIARWSGKKFSAILPNTDVVTAVRTAEETRKNIEKVAIFSKDNISQHLTVSIGIGSMAPKNENTIEEIIKVADRELRQAKDTGKNKVCYTLQ